MQNLEFLAQHQKVISTLLRRELFQYIPKLIEQLNYPYVFPFDINNASITILNEISEIKHALRNGRYQVEIRTGFVEPEYYPLFEIKRYPTLQISAQEKAGFSYIQLRKPNIILSKIRHHLPFEVELSQCDTIDQIKICPM